ncbi:MAG: carboxypeptidase regulatory-like domain-containing protein [Myxococcales bacterium]|nr:carboxypeptidase regulatory-like domain-containing protein [Myxococcales bacterium]
MRLARALAAVAVIVAAASAARADNPLVHVRGRLRIDLDGVERAPGGLTVSGSLRDDATDEPVPGRTIAISVEGDHGFWHYAEPSGPDGSFRWHVPVPLGAYRLHLGAGGDDDYLAPVAIDRAVDVNRRTPTVTVQVPARIAAHAPSLHVVVEAHESDGLGPPRAFDGDVWLSIGGRRRTSLVVRDGHGETDELGPFGRPGDRVDVSATIAATDERNSATGTRTVVLTTPTATTLSVDGKRVGANDEIGVDGLVRDDEGFLGHVVVDVGLENGASLARFTSDEHGRFSGFVPARELPPGGAFLEARYTPHEDWRDASVSPTVPIEVLAAPPVAVWPYVVSPALTLFAALVVFAARDRRWRRYFLVARRARRIAAAPATSPGLTESRRGILSSLRRPDHGVSGVVVDAADDRAIVQASLVARAADGQSHAATVDEQGRFAFEDLAAGPLVVEIAAPGYVAERFARTLPHRGELRNARVRLVPVRARIFEAWRRAAAPLYPTPRAAETMTPGELLDHLQRRRLLPNDSMATLTRRVEAAVWGARPPSMDDLADVERLASALKADV